MNLRHSRPGAVRAARALPAGAAVADRYEIVVQLNSGAFADVYRARDRSTDRQVALKIWNREAVDGEWSTFEEEARSSAKVSHPNVASLIDRGVTSHGDPFLVFDFIPGRTLRQVIVDGGPVRPALALRWMSELLDALAAVHAQGIVHRDVKPENVMITGPGIVEHAVLLDLGFGALAQNQGDATAGPAELAGTPRYAAPEVVRGEAATCRSDLYSWGLVLVECLTGSSPIRADSACEAVEEQLGPEPVPVPERWAATPLGWLLREVTCKTADRRPENAERVFARLAEVLPSLPALLPDVARRGAERRRVTVVSARLTNGCPEDVRSFPASEYEAIEEMCRCSGGSVVSAVGDRITAVFGLRHFDSRDTERAVDFADALAGRPWTGSDIPAWSVGVNTGEIAVRDDSNRFENVNVLLGATCAAAASLDELAPCGRVVVSGETEKAVSRLWVTSALELMHPERIPATAGAFRLRRRKSSERETFASEPITGRRPERELLEASWKAGITRGTNAVLLIGQAGIGKSRLVREARRIAAGADWLEFRCTVERHGIPLSGVVSLVRTLDADAATLARRYRLPATEAVPILATLLGEPMPEGYSMPPVTPERYRELVAGTVLRLLVEVAGDGPTVIVAEDLHWADPSSLEFLSLLVQEVSRRIEAGKPLPLLVLLTSRTEFAETWNVDGLVRIGLQPMPASDVQRMIRSGLSGGDADAGMVDALVDASGGLPLFVEQATRLIANRLAASSEDREIPRSIDAVLAAQIALLGEDARKVAQVAAALGHYFDGDLVGEAATLPAAALQAALHDLSKAGLVSRSAGESSTACAFTHVLIRDAAYRSVAESDRAALHRRIARAMQEHRPEIGLHRPAELALQLEMAQEAVAAAELWHRAGMQAMANAGYPEACDDLARGIRLLETLPETPDRTMRVLALHTALGSAHVMMKGFSAPEARHAFQTASRMCRKAGRDVPLEVLGGLFGAALVAADREELDAVLPHFRALSQRTDSPIFAFSGHQVLSVESYWNGRLEEAWHHAEISMDLYRREAVHGVSWEFGFGIHCYAYGMLSLFHRGYPEESEAVRLEMLERARRNGNPHCVAVALGWSTIRLLLGKRAEETIDESNRLIRLAEEQHLPLWATYAAISRGTMMAESGDAAEAVPAVRQAMERLEAMGAFVNRIAYSPYWARVLLAADDVEGALEAVRYGMHWCERVWPRVQEPELVRLHGVVLERLGRSEDAEREFRRALAIARADGNVAAEKWIIESAPSLDGRA